MESILSDALAISFFLLFLVQQGSTDELDSLFGGKTSTKDAMLYTAIIIFIISCVALLFVIFGLFVMHQSYKRRYRQVQAASVEVDRWRGEVDEFILDSHRMVPIPRAKSMQPRSSTLVEAMS
ncbi:uncharacterized protein LOC116286366 isoform X2 [Actinia tenebrosa]|uniref:Uncharacterized protein LOC116286366 isoform X2 n=1 Tax=Actinia tenebrosa TaxID=6105 RepID=A0A6P8H010_ACTTE|nr:uncharacterized protein LOC116286366 isoform X2 [Actinia tenebrosa]